MPYTYKKLENGEYAVYNKETKKLVGKTRQLKKYLAALNINESVKFKKFATLVEDITVDVVNQLKEETPAERSKKLQDTYKIRPSKGGKTYDCIVVIKGKEKVIGTAPDTEAAAKKLNQYKLKQKAKATEKAISTQNPMPESVIKEGSATQDLFNAQILPILQGTKQYYQLGQGKKLELTTQEAKSLLLWLKGCVKYGVNVEVPIVFSSDNRFEGKPINLDINTTKDLIIWLSTQIEDGVL